MQDNDIIGDAGSRAIARDELSKTIGGGSRARRIQHQFNITPPFQEYCINAVLAICELLEQRNLYIGCPATRDENINDVSRIALRFPRQLLLLDRYGGDIHDSDCDNLIRDKPSPDDTRQDVARMEKNILSNLRAGCVTQRAESEIDRLVADLGEKEAAIMERNRLERKEQNRVAAKERCALEPKRPRRVHPKAAKKVARPAPSEGS